MALPKVTEPIAGQWPVSVAWRGWLESLDRRLTILSSAEAPTVTFPDPPQLVAGDGVTVYGGIGWGQAAILSLKLLPDSGVGTFQKITRDGYGRVSGTEPVTPADMLNPFATYLVDGNGDYLTDADGNFLVSDDGTLVQDSITDGVVDKAPSQNAVFDALAGKANDNAVVHTTGNETIAGTKTLTAQVKIQAGYTTGGLVAGADVNSNTVSANTRKIFRMTCPTYDGTSLPVLLLAGDMDSVGQNNVFFGGAPGASGSTAATIINFCTEAVANTMGGTVRWQVRQDGGFRPATNNAYDVGSSAFNVRATYSGLYFSGSVQVVGARNTGWSAMTGTGSKGAIAAAAAGTASAAYVQAELQAALNRIAALEARLKALDDALFTHGLIGT